MVFFLQAYQTFGRYVPSVTQAIFSEKQVTPFLKNPVKILFKVPSSKLQDVQYFKSRKTNCMYYKPLLFSSGSSITFRGMFLLIERVLKVFNCQCFLLVRHSRLDVLHAVPELVFEFWKQKIIMQTKIMEKRGWSALVILSWSNTYTQKV